MNKTYSIMDTQHNLAQVLREVAAGYEVGITRRKKMVARIVPAESDDQVQFPEFASRARQAWGKSWSGISSDRLLDEARGER